VKLFFFKLSSSPSYRVLGVCGLLLLSGCSGSGQDDIQKWMAEARQATYPAVPRIQEPSRFTPFPYNVQSQIDPFSSQKVELALAKASQRGGGGLKPDLDRRREPLEAFPLDTIKMVGSIERNKQRYALLRTDTGLYQTKVGQYRGQNFGMITQITETQLSLRELVLDAVGDWVERTSTLKLQESYQEKK
jgi:type IV pilus assembly protein PilP